MGADFRWLAASSYVTNVADGIALAAGPLLVASQTRDPFLIALATLLQRLPWLLFGLHAGVLADRVDRRRLLVLVNLVRAALLAALTLTIVTDRVDVTVVLVTLFLAGTAEVFVDTTGTTVLPMIVESHDLGIANARLIFGNITINRLAGPPIGAALFAAGMAWPFVGQAVALAFGALLTARITIGAPRRRERAVSTRAEIADGVRWVWRHPAIRTLTVTIVAFNITFGAVIAILVLYSIEQLGLGDIGFGLLTASGAAGGIVGTMLYGRLERSLGMANIMRVGLLIETSTHLIFAINTNPLVAMGVFFVFGIHESAWGTTAVTIRQRAVPEDYQGRVASVYLVGVFGSLVVGNALGGVIASVSGVTGPYWFAFVGSVLILLVIWRELDEIATDHA